MATKLPLDSPRWQQLQSFGGNGAALPVLIRRAQAGPDGVQAVARLEDLIYQQYSCCEATFAVVPHLVELVASYPTDRRAPLCILLGSIAATCDLPPGSRVEDLIPAYRSALADAEPLCVETLLAGAWDLQTSYYLGVSAIGLAAHPLGGLFMDNLVPHAKANSTAVCPRCGTSVVVAVFDTGLVAYSGGSQPYPKAPEPGRTPTAPVNPTTPGRDPNPWAEVGRRLHLLIGGLTTTSYPGLAHVRAASVVAESGLTPRVSASGVFSLLGALITLKGFPDRAMRFYHACDSITCPSCSLAFVFAEHWWGLPRQRPGQR